MAGCRCVSVDVHTRRCIRLSLAKQHTYTHTHRHTQTHTYTIPPLNTIQYNTIECSSYHSIPTSNQPTSQQSINPLTNQPLTPPFSFDSFIALYLCRTEPNALGVYLRSAAPGECRGGGGVGVLLCFYVALRGTQGDHPPVSTPSCGPSLLRISLSN